MPPMTPSTEREFESFLASATEIVRTPLCPEIALCVAPALQHLWRAKEDWFGSVGGAPPYWGVPWPGGQALARFVLDNPRLMRGRTVLDVGAGSGLCAIAAAMAGGTVTAADIDSGATHAAAANARQNGVRVMATTIDPIDSAERWDVVLAADLWYERFMAGRITGWLRLLAARGTMVLLGDVGRSYFPRCGLFEVGRYLVSGVVETEPAAVVQARVWTFSPSAFHAAALP